MRSTKPFAGISRASRPHRDHTSAAKVGTLGLAPKPLPERLVAALLSQIRHDESKKRPATLGIIKRINSPEQLGEAALVEEGFKNLTRFPDGLGVLGDAFEKRVGGQLAHGTSIGENASLA